MLKYCLTAAALKAFSCTAATRRLYRFLGNTVGARKRASSPMPDYYLERVRRMLALNRRRPILADGSRLLELGTGWLHWEALTTRLFFDIEATLFDVWDNRQLSGVKHYLGQLRDRLGFRYVVEPQGRLHGLPAAAFDVVVSAGVLEHVHVSALPDLLAGIAAVLRPGGFSVHSINLRDHLSAYDRRAFPKQYLQYSDRAWRWRFENAVQYVNRLQRPEWADRFRAAGLQLVEEEVEREELGDLRIAGKYAGCHPDDLACAGLRLVHRKPAND